MFRCRVANSFPSKEKQSETLFLKHGQVVNIKNSIVICATFHQQLDVIFFFKFWGTSVIFLSFTFLLNFLFLYLGLYLFIYSFIYFLHNWITVIQETLITSLTGEWESAKVLWRKWDKPSPHDGGNFDVSSKRLTSMSAVYLKSPQGYRLSTSRSWKNNGNSILAYRLGCGILDLLHFSLTFVLDFANLESKYNDITYVFSISRDSKYLSVNVVRWIHSKKKTVQFHCCWLHLSCLWLNE